MVLSRVDFGSAVLIGLAAYLLRRVQSVQNAAARLIYRLRRSDHITDALVNLQLLRVAERVEFKTAVLVYKVLHRQAPRYLGPLTRVADLPGRPAFRSTGSNRLHASETSLQKLRCILSSIILRVTEVLYFCETALLHFV